MIVTDNNRWTARTWRRVAVLILPVLAWNPEAALGQAVDLRRVHIPAWQLEGDLRLGSADGPDDAFVLPRIGSVGDDGLIYIIDRTPAVAEGLR